MHTSAAQQGDRGGGGRGTAWCGAASQDLQRGSEELQSVFWKKLAAGDVKVETEFEVVENNCAEDRLALNVFEMLSSPRRTRWLKQMRSSAVVMGWSMDGLEKG